MPSTADRIAANLRRLIDSGELAPGAPLPTVKGLAAAEGVSLVTAQAALTQLRDLGLVHTTRGKGGGRVANPNPIFILETETYDRSRRRDKEGRTTFEQQAAAIGEKGRQIHHAPYLTTAVPDWVAGLLGSHEAIHMQGEGWSAPVGNDGQPDMDLERKVSIYDNWCPAWLAEAVPEVAQPFDAEYGADYWSRMEDTLGIRLTEREQDIYGAVSTEEETERLERERPTQLLVEDIVVRDPGGRVLVVTRNRKLFGLARWKLRLPIGD